MMMKYSDAKLRRIELQRESPGVAVGFGGLMKLGLGHRMAGGSLVYEPSR